MTQNEVSIIKNAVLDSTEAYVDARLEVLDYVKTQIGVVVSATKNPSNKKWYHTVRCNKTQHSDGILYNNVLSVNNIHFQVDSVVFLAAPNAQFSSQFILGKLDNVPYDIVGGSITLGNDDPNNAPIYLTSTPTRDESGNYYYGHIAGFYIYDHSLRLTGDEGGKTIFEGDKLILTKFKDNQYKIGMAMDASESYIAINTNNDVTGGVIVADQIGWNDNGNFNDPTSGSSRRYTKVNVNSVEMRMYIDSRYRVYYITPQAVKFLDVNQDELASMNISFVGEGLRIEDTYHDRRVTIPWD